MLVNHSFESGMITNVTVFGRITYGSSTYQQSTSNKACFVINSDGEYRIGDEFNVTSNWILYHASWSRNPVTNTSWIWSDIDALEAGVALKGTEHYGLCTQVYVVVNYTGPSWYQFGTNITGTNGNGTYGQVLSNATAGCQWFWRVVVDDQIESNESPVYSFYTIAQSKIKNTGSTNISGYVLIQVQFNDSGEWMVADETVNESSPRTILSGDQLGLDELFNGKIDASKLFGSYGVGLYRVYAVFRDLEGNILVNDDDSLMVAAYEFTIDK